MLDLSSLQLNSEYPAVTSAILTSVTAMLLGVLLTYTYEKTSKDNHRPAHFMEAMILITIVASTIMLAIGDSVARGLGMLGALSIIRFRTTVRNPRNIVFMFSAISIGIACGVFGILIAIIGTVIFCLTAFLLHYTSYSPTIIMIGSIKLTLDNSIEIINNMNSVLDKHTKSYTLQKKIICYKKKLKK